MPLRNSSFNINGQNNNNYNIIIINKIKLSTYRWKEQAEGMRSKLNSLEYTFSVDLTLEQCVLHDDKAKLTQKWKSSLKKQETREYNYVSSWRHMERIISNDFKHSNSTLHI